jgi:hypothetical protein
MIVTLLSYVNEVWGFDEVGQKKFEPLRKMGPVTNLAGTFF